MESLNGPEYCKVSEDQLLLEFHPVTEDEVRKIIIASPTKSCMLDPIPTHLLKDLLVVLIPIITCIINLSLSTARVPACYKIAAVTPLLQKHNLDANSLKDVRPVSKSHIYVQKFLKK